jgi:hypothetical protein
MFDLRRFLRLAAVHWAEYGRAYLWFMGIGVAVHLCVWLLITGAGRQAERYSIDLQIMVFVCGYVLSGVLFAGRYFSVLARNESALTYLMRPASTFEKFLLALLVVALLYPLAYTIAFQLCNLPGAWLGQAARDALAVAADDEPLTVYMINQDYGPYLPFTDADAPRWELNLFLGGIGLQGLVVAGVLYFRRVAWLKTVVALFVLLVVVLPLLTVLFGASPGQLFLDNPFGDASAGLEAWRWVLWIGVPALFWASAFFFLRERALS